VFFSKPIYISEIKKRYMTKDMKIQTKKIKANGIKLFVMQDKKEVGRAYLYLLHNDLHNEPFGFMEDVFVEEEYRKSGIGTELVNALIKEAKKSGCYKLIGTSRHERCKVHDLYKRIGFADHGVEFRINFEQH
jgi:GNAT superfamily N-acetyltransferase